MSPPPMPPSADDAAQEVDLEELQALLDALPVPLQALDVSALDGYLCGVLLQPNAVETSRWMRWVLDVEGRSPPAELDTARLQALVQRRLAQLTRAIRTRQWFDPWIFELDGEATPAETVLPWIAGFAAAMDHFPDLMRTDDAELLEPLALLYMHFDADDLEDADALQQLIEGLEPPLDLGEAVQDIVRSLMLIADVVQPLGPAARPRPPRRGGRPRKSR